MRKITYIDTFTMCDYDSYIEFCENNLIDESERVEDGSKEFYDWCYEEMQFDIDCFFDNIKSSKYNQRCLVDGSVGRWNGRLGIEPRMFDDLEEAIRACCSNAEDFVIEKIGSMLKVTAYHHDGHDSFKIHILSDKGIDRFIEHGRASMLNRENFIKLDEYLF